MNALKQAYLDEAAVQTGSELERIIAGWHSSSMSQTHGRLEAQLKLLGRAATGGKLLRGTLVQLGYELAGGQDTASALPVAAAYELLHTGLLIHDDIIDHSPVRRGHPAVHIAAGSGHTGLSQAICLGDAAFFLALTVITESPLEPAVRAELAARFSRIAQDTILGEMLDVSLAGPGSAKRAADVLAIARLKTAAYTFIGPLTAGAVIAGAPAPVLSALERYGEYAGLAYQIQDDILGVFGDEADTGKSATSDIEEDKNTLLIAYALAHATPEQSAELMAIYGNTPITPAQLTAVREIFTATGALAHARSQAQKYVTLAIKTIKDITTRPEHIQILDDLARLSLARKN